MAISHKIKPKNDTTPGLKFTPVVAFVVAFLLLYCTPNHAAAETPLAAMIDKEGQVTKPAQTLSETLVISTPGAVWVRDKHPLITLTGGSLIVIAGKQSVSIRTAAGDVYIPAGLAAMVQQENNLSVRISMIGVRGMVAEPPDHSEWAVTITTADDSIYKLGFGDVLLISSNNGSDTTLIHQAPSVCKLMREAAHQLNSIALALNVNGVLLADKIANNCASVLLTLAQGNTISATQQLKYPVRVFVDDGTKFVALHPSSSIYTQVAHGRTPTATGTALVAVGKKKKLIR